MRGDATAGGLECFGSVPIPAPWAVGRRRTEPRLFSTAIMDDERLQKIKGGGLEVSDHGIEYSLAAKAQYRLG